MPKAANTLHSDQVPSAQAGIAKSVVGRDTRAEERGSFCGTQLVRNGSDASGFSNHHFRISSVCGHSRYHWDLTIDRVSASARFAHFIVRDLYHPLNFLRSTAVEVSAPGQLRVVERQVPEPG